MQAAKHERSQDSQEDLLPPTRTTPRRWLPWVGALSWMALIGSTSLVMPQYFSVTQAEALLLSIGSAILCNLLVLRTQVYFLNNWLYDNQWFPDWDNWTMDQEEEAELEAEVLALLNSGRKFEAIQLVRSYTDCTLHEAKEFIYALESGK
jgi:hypothetical protein